jgi:hypothetical protein
LGADAATAAALIGTPVAAAGTTALHVCAAVEAWAAFCCTRCEFCSSCLSSSASLSSCKGCIVLPAAAGPEPLRILPAAGTAAAAAAKLVDDGGSDASLSSCKGLLVN